MHFKRSHVVLGVLTILTVAAGAATARAGESPVAHLHSAFFMPCPDYPAPPDPTLAGCNGFSVGGTRVASVSQAVILAIGDVESSQADCKNGVAATTHTFTIDGNPVPITVDPCRYFPPDFQQINPSFWGNWGVFYKYLIRPGALARGIHDITFTTHWVNDFTYSLGCGDPSGRCTVAAGTVEVDEGQLLVE
jgi:hypothetical protein